MRAIPPGLAARLAAGVTTLARCWTLRRRDGLALGFTDHDRDLVVEGITHAAGAGMEAADSHAELGFAVGGGEVAGALSAPALAEADLVAGRWDGASVEVRLVDWQDPSSTVLLDSGIVGEVRRAGTAFTAELRGPAHRLDEPRGRLFQAACSADLGDGRCRIPLADARWSGRGTVMATDGERFLVASGLGGFAPGLFTGGRLAFAGGDKDGLSVEVQLHRVTAAGAELTLWEPMPLPLATGDAFVVTAGCDRQFATCRDRFSNTANFRGFPHIPGTDVTLRSVNDGDPGMDGGSLFR